MPSYLVTGASRGLGYAWIKHLSSDSSNTIIGVVRNKEATLARLAADNISNVEILSADITDFPALQAAASQIPSGSLDILIHNAAYVSDRSNFLSVTDDIPKDLVADLRESFESNVIGTANVINAFLPLIKKGTEKKVIVTSSGMADNDFINRFFIPMATPYAVSKAASNTLVAKYHAALGKSENILFLSMSPGFVATKEKYSDEEIKGFEQMGEMFKEYAPHFKGPLKPEESVELQLKVIGRATVEEFGGGFVSHFGDRQWL